MPPRRKRAAPMWTTVRTSPFHQLKPTAFSGATDCDGIRKTMKYELAAQPFVLQVSGTKANAISIAILPSE